MKRRSHGRADEPLLKKTAKPCPTETLQSKITAKLQSLFNGFVSELQNISTDSRPDLSEVFSTKHSVESTVLRHEHSEDASSLALQNFIDSAKSRISHLLSSKKISNEKNQSLQSFPRQKRASVVDPLQVQISAKLQSLLCKALESKKPKSCGKKTQAVTGNEITENEWQDLSSLLQDFMSSARKKISASLKPPLALPPVNGSVTSLSQSPDVSKNFKAKLKSSLSSESQNLQNRDFQTHSEVPLSSSSAVYSAMQRRKQPIGLESMYSRHSVSQFQDMISVQDDDDDCVLLTKEPERITDYLELEVDSDPDLDVHVESDEEVVVLDVKKPTYEEITIDEDDDDEIYEVLNNQSKSSGTDDEIEELLFPCPQCDKRFRVESLLKFHIRMHGPETSTEPMTMVSSPVQENESNKTAEEVLLNTNRRSPRKEKENKSKPVKSLKQKSTLKLRDTSKSKK